MGMLCLTRRPDESIFIDVGEVRIRVTLIDIKGTRGARLGIEAPPHVRIMREELLRRDESNGEAKS